MGKRQPGMAVPQGGKRAQSGVTVLLGGKNKNGWGAEALHP
jgi:hypothetical protein